jgi:hypothetical protein
MNNMFHRILNASALLVALIPSAQARDIYVNNTTGDDRRMGTLPESQGELGPCRTIAKALRIAKPTDRIVLAATNSPYRESITLQGARHSGIDRFPFVIVGNGATLDGTMSLEGADWEYVGQDTFRTRPPLMSHQQLFLDGQPAARNQPADPKYPKLAAREWCLVDGWIYFRVDQGKLPESYNLSCCGEQVGITLYDVHDVIVEDLVLRGFQLDAVNCHDNVRRTDLVRLTTTNNGRSGISIGGASRVRIDTCTSAGNGEAQVRLEGYCIVELLDNVLDAGTAPGVVREGGRIVQSQGQGE